MKKWNNRIKVSTLYLELQESQREMEVEGIRENPMKLRVYLMALESHHQLFDLQRNPITF